MPAINLDFCDEDYERVRAAAERERVPLKSFARTSVLARVGSAPAEWALVTATPETLRILSPAAEKLMQSRRDVSPEDVSEQATGCAWLHLTANAAVVTYPTAPYVNAGKFEFLLDRDGTAAVLESWSAEKGLAWHAGDASGQHAARQLAIAIGSRRLGAAQ